jgi:hypothetical protein
MRHVRSVIVKLWSVTLKVVTRSLEGIAEGLTIIPDVAGKPLVFNIILLCLGEGFNQLFCITRGTQVIFRYL